MSSDKQRLDAFRVSQSEEFAKACPSRALEMALEDLEWAELNPRYTVDMDIWHMPHDDEDGELGKSCSVCFAGSVMARRLGTSIETTSAPYDFDDPTEERLDFLDTVRCGYPLEGLDELGHEISESFAKVLDGLPITAYEDSSTKFKVDIQYGL